MKAWKEPIQVVNGEKRGYNWESVMGIELHHPLHGLKPSYSKSTIHPTIAGTETRLLLFLGEKRQKLLIFPEQILFQQQQGKKSRWRIYPIISNIAIFLIGFLPQTLISFFPLPGPFWSPLDP